MAKTKWGNDLSNEKLGYHLFTRDQLTQALDDYATKHGWKWGNHGKKKTKAFILMHKKKWYNRSD